MPLDAIAAVTDPDPYPFYAALRARQPALAHDPALRLRIAARPDAIAAVLASDLVAVRPPGQPMPPALAGTAAGALFARLMRQSDGERHALARPATAALAGFTAAARAAARAVSPPDDAHDLPRLALALPATALGAVLGVVVPELAARVDALARAFAPGAAPETVAAGDAAAGALLAAVDDALAARRSASLAAFVDAGAAPRDVRVANAVGLFVQAHEATAGLIGAALLALARGGASTAAGAVAAATRHDPPVHNTRRYVIEGGAIAGQPVAAGETILLVLAAAPELGFGAGRHACPGQALAVELATAAVESVLAAGTDLAPLRAGVRYRPSHNTRVIAELLATRRR